MPKEFEQLFKEGFLHENRDWVYFGFGEGWKEGKCDECYRLLRQDLKPNRHCINCWKLEIFFSNCTDLEEVKRFLIDESIKDRTLHGKWLKREMKIPKGVLTSIPEAGHPDKGVKKEGVILVYTQSIKERDEKKERILTGLREKGLYKKSALSYRRGCVNFDELIGSWKKWHYMDRDYSE